MKSNGAASTSTSGHDGEATVGAPTPKKAPEETSKKKASLVEIYSVLAASVPIQCLAVMSLAMGLCSSLMEFAWCGVWGAVCGVQTRTPAATFLLP